jgi:hypothetical protein
VGCQCSPRVVREEEDGHTELTEDINGCLSSGGGPAAVIEGGGNFLLVSTSLGSRRVKNEDTTV